MEASARERMLKKIRKSLIETTEQPFATDNSGSVFQPATESLDVIFAEEFTKISGQFIYCENEEDLIRNLNLLAEERSWSSVFAWEFPLQEMLQRLAFKRMKVGPNIEKADAGITFCEQLVARTGTIILSSRQASGRSLSIFPPVHIAVAFNNQIVYDLKEGIANTVEKHNDHLPSMISIATGPSRTADIEKTLVLGAHGPKEVFVFFIDQPFNA